MNLLRAIWNGILDALFAKSDVEQRIRNLTDVDMANMMRAQTRKDGTVSLFRFETPLIREMVFALKYRRNEHVTHLFASGLRTYVQTLHFPHVTFVPIPLSSKRRAERGYNQIELVLSHVHIENAQISTALQKIKETPPQTTLHRSERLINLNDAFSIRNTAEIRGKHIILIDDVTTTGSTLQKASRVLLDNGAKSVLRVALAR